MSETEALISEIVERAAPPEFKERASFYITRERLKEFIIAVLAEYHETVVGKD